MSAAYHPIIEIVHDLVDVELDDTREIIGMSLSQEAMDILEGMIPTEREERSQALRAVELLSIAHERDGMRELAAALMTLCGGSMDPRRGLRSQVQEAHRLDARRWSRALRDQRHHKPVELDDRAVRSGPLARFSLSLG